MKKTLLAFTLASMFIAGAVQAQDTSATVNMSGTVTGNATDCSVFTNSTVTLSGDVSALPEQGTKATSPTVLNYSIGLNGDTSCLNQVALQLVGLTDDAEGTVLSNTDYGTSAARGVGIGLFDSTLNPLKTKAGNISVESSNGQINLQLVRLKAQQAIEGTVHSSMTLNVIRL
jgi:major type 1 subunit fimbrin (pilin)